VVGSGVHTYECVHDWLTPPDGLVWGDTHGLAQDEQGRIYVAHTVNKSSMRGESVVIYDADGRFVSAFGEEFSGRRSRPWPAPRNRRRISISLRYQPLQDRENHPGRKDCLVAWLSSRRCGLCRTPYRFCADQCRLFAQWRFLCWGWIRLASPAALFAERQVFERNWPAGPWRRRVRYAARLVGRSTRQRTRAASGRPRDRRVQTFTLSGTHIRTIKDDAHLRNALPLSCSGRLEVCPDLDSQVCILDREHKVVAQLGDGQAQTEQLGLVESNREPNLRRDSSSRHMRHFPA